MTLCYAVSSMEHHYRLVILERDCGGFLIQDKQGDSWVTVDDWVHPTYQEARRVFDEYERKKIDENQN